MKKLYQDMEGCSKKKSYTVIEITKVVGTVTSIINEINGKEWMIDIGKSQ